MEAGGVECPVRYTVLGLMRQITYGIRGVLPSRGTGEHACQYQRVSIESQWKIVASTGSNLTT